MRKLLLVGAAAAGLATQAHAVPLVLEGNFIRVGISDAGTFGSNGNNQPGFQHNAAGTGAPFASNRDYISPGIPHDGFSIKSAQTGWIQNDNAAIGGAFGTASPTLTSVAGFSLAATWTGSSGGQVQVTNTYFYNPGDERVNVSTTITALTNLTDLRFARSVDPDSDNAPPFNTASTINTRGNTTLAPEDLIASEGAVTGLFLAILNLSGNTFTHNTRIDGSCCSNIDPDVVLGGGGALFPATSTGDQGMNMAWDIGTLNQDQSVTIRYAYVVGDEIGDIVVDPPTRVPGPPTLALLGLGIAALGFARRRFT